MPRFLALLRCGLCLAALACASGTPPPPPGWLDERPAPYRAERWVVGVGSGASAPLAEDDALGKVAKQTGGLTAGAEIADTWVNQSTGLRWALAVLDRVPLRADTEAELARLEGEIDSARDRSRGAPPEDGLPEILRALELLAERDALQERLAMLGGPAVLDEDELAFELQAELAAIKRNLTIEISAHEMDPKTGAIGEPVDELRRKLAERVTGLGFPVSTRSWGSDQDPIWIFVEMRLGLDPLDLPDRDRLVAVHWDAALEIADGAGKLISVLTEEGRSTHVSQHEARRQARELAEDFAGAALEDWLSGRVMPRATATR